MTRVSVLERIGVRLPIVQAPMSNVGTPALAAAVANAGALGSIAVGAMTAVVARDAIRAARAATVRPIAVNVFCHRSPVAEPAREAAWIARWAPAFARFGATPPAALRAAGAVLIATVTSVDEGRTAVAAGMDAVVAPGIDAGGHRGTFDTDALDDALSALVLTRVLVRALAVPVIAAGGVMDGAGIAAALDAGACAAQPGTAFIACPESAADASFRAELLGASPHTMMTRAISGRPARCIRNAFALAAEEGAQSNDVPDYPIAYDAAKAVMAAARGAGELGYAVRFAGQGAPLARALPAARLVELLCEELEAARRGAPKAPPSNA